MVNLLEALYVVTALAFLCAILASLGGRARPARLLFMATVVCAVLAISLYWYLGQRF